MSEGAHTFEWFIEDRQGHAMWQEVRLQKVRLKGRQCIMAMSRDITERKEREIALSSSEEKLRLALQAANEVTFELDMDTLDIVGGRRLFQMMGYPPFDGPASLDLLQDLVHPDDLTIIAEWLEGDRSKVVHDIQIRVRAASGHYRWLGIKANLVDKTPSSLGRRLMGTIRDITEKKMAEEATIRNAEIVQALMDATSDMAFLIDSDTRLLAFNDAFVNALGANKDELLGRTMMDVLEMRKGSANRPVSALSYQRAAMLQSVIATGSGMSFLEEYGGRHLQHTLRPILGVNDKVERVAVFSRDVTDQLQGEKDLVESEERFRGFMEQSSDGLLLSDEEGRIIEVNRAALEELGVEKGAILGMAVWDLHFASLQPERRSMETYESLVRMYGGALQTGQGDFLSKLIDERFQLRGGRRYDLQVVFWTIRSSKGHRLAASIRDVTDRKAAETALKESEEKFRELIQQSTDAIILWDEKGDVCEYNSASVSLLGITESELRNLKGWDAHLRFLPEEAKDPERVAAMRRAFDVVHETGNAPFMGKVMEFDLMRNDGSKRTVETVLFPIQTSKGYRIGSISRDVTEARQAQMEAKESEERLRSFFDGAFEGVYIIGPDGRITDCNRRLLEMMQLRSDQVIGTHAWDLMYQFLMEDRRSPGRLAGFKNIILDSLSGGRTAVANGPISARIMLPDGSSRDVEQGQFSFRSHHGNQIGVVVRDVTERRRAEEVLLQSEANYRTLFESLLDSAVIFDHATGLIMDCNRNGLDFLGCRSVDEARNETIWNRGGLSREDVLSMLARTLQEGPLAFEHEMKGKDGRPTWVELRLRMVSYSGQERALMMARNVTERKRSEEALVNLNRKLSLLGSITRHDILNQLAALMGYLQLQRDMADRPEELANLAKAERSAQTIRQQIEFTGDYEEMGTKLPQWQRSRRRSSCPSSWSALPCAVWRSTPTPCSARCSITSWRTPCAMEDP
jgi:PAS domain S-box-containing protein